MIHRGPLYWLWLSVAIVGGTYVGMEIVFFGMVALGALLSAIHL